MINRKGILIFETSDCFDTQPIVSAACIGTFDGLHRGHLLVVETLKREAHNRRLRPLVFSFNRHPLTVVAPERAPEMLMTPEQRTAILAEMGVEPVCIDFTPDVQHLTAGEWLSLLKTEFGVELLVIGYDNTFGCDGHKMSHSDMEQTAHKFGIETVSAPKYPDASSSAARNALISGDVSTASRILGYPYTLEGRVTKGEQLGRTIGFPTANLLPPEGLVIPKNGVYAAIAILPDGSEHPAMVNIGCRPTLGSGLKKTIEANIIDFSGNLYGKTLAIRFMKRLRDEQRFSNLDQLQQQLKKDRSQTCQLFEI